MADSNSGENDHSLPKVSCLMVTADRKQLMKRAIRCFNRQTHPNKELVIVDDGKQNLDESLRLISEEELNYIKLDPYEDRALGTLRNIALENASGEFVTQWDDDDWYHRQRIAVQVRFLQQGYDACCVQATLMHVNDPPFTRHAYIGTLPEGVPGSIMHRRDSNIRYPDYRKAEDTEFLEAWRQKRYVKLPKSYAYLFIRSYHGANTWGEHHFLRRIRNNPIDYGKYIWYRYIRGDLFKHPRFQLTSQQKKAFQTYLKDSRELGLTDS